MKKTITSKTILRIAGIIAIVALIGFSFAACDNGTTSSRVSGTYWKDINPALSITFSGNNFTIAEVGYPISVTGNYSVSGSTVFLTLPGGGSDWLTIVDSKTLKYSDGTTWRKR